jgi:glycine oxidase
MPYDAVFVGGGAIGLASALASARAGMSVAVIDPDPGRGASWVAAGMLAPVTETHFGEEDHLRLLLEAAAAWPDFADELEAATGLDVGYRRCGTVLVALDASDRLAVDRLLGYQQALGLEAERRSAAQCRALVPALSPGVCGGAEVPGDHQVDNRRLIEALVAACGGPAGREPVGGAPVVGAPGLPVRLVRQRAAAIEWDRTGGRCRARGVRLDGGDMLSAGAVVLAAGCDSPRVGGLPPAVAPPVRPVKGHVLRLRGPVTRPLLERTVRALVHGRSCYLVPRHDGSLVVGATMEERGYDRAVQAGAVHQLLSDARAAVPGIDELELEECSAGLRPGSPDNSPLVGWSAADRLLVATGHHRNGILLAPLTATAVASLLAGRPVDSALAGFGPRRFDAGTGASR